MYAQLFIHKMYSLTTKDEFWSKIRALHLSTFETHPTALQVYKLDQMRIPALQPAVPCKPKSRELPPNTTRKLSSWLPSPSDLLTKKCCVTEIMTSPLWCSCVIWRPARDCESVTFCSWVGEVRISLFVSLWQPLKSKELLYNPKAAILIRLSRKLWLLLEVWNKNGGFL